MKLHAPFIQLPLSFDADALAREVRAIGEDAWMDHPQKFPGNSMLPLVAVDGDPANEDFSGPMHPTPHLERCPYLQQVLASFGAVVGRTRLMRLSSGAEVTRHADQGYYWTDRVRIHVPVVTQPDVSFECDTAVINMAAGECWIFDTWRQHRVVNQNEFQRIHLVCDSVGGPVFWEYVRAGRSVGQQGASPEGWKPGPIARQSGAIPQIVYEHYNVPVVMSPWELRQHLEFLLEEAMPFPGLPMVRRMVADLCRDWRCLWAMHGTEEDALPKYRQRARQFVVGAQSAIGNAMLRNNLPLLQVIVVMVIRPAVADASTVGVPGEAMA